MNQTLLLLAVAGAFLTATGVYHMSTTSTTVDSVSESIKGAFTLWKTNNARIYQSASEEAYRLSVFDANLKIAKEHNASGSSFTMGATKFSDMTNAEFRAIYTATKPNTKKSEKIFDGVPTMGQIDWRNKGAVTDVKDQAQCGSCWAFSTTGSMEGRNFVATGSLVSLSEQQLVDCSSSYGNMGCNGGLMDSAFQYIEENALARESDYSYTGQDGSCRHVHGIVQNTGFTDVRTNSMSAMQSALEEGVVSIAVNAGGMGWQMYTGGVMKNGDGFADCSTGQIDHGVLAVGYNNAGGYYTVKNSWGPSWGENGYIRLNIEQYGEGTCSMYTQASFPTF